MPSQEIPIEYRRQGEDYRYFGFNHLFDKDMPYTAGTFKQIPEKNHRYGLHKTTAFIAGTFALVLVLAIIAASFAASQTAKGKKAEVQCMKDKEALALQIQSHSSQTCKDPCTATVPQTSLPTVARPSAITESITLQSETTIFSCVSSTSPSTTTVTTCPFSCVSSTSPSTTTITTCPSNAASAQTSSLPSPVNDCSSLNPPYIVDNPGGQSVFQINCTTDSPTPYDLLEVYVYTFEDCIKGCASYNWNSPEHPGSACYAVTWRPSAREASGGNCNFKYQNNLTLVQSDSIDLAVLLED